MTSPPVTIDDLVVVGSAIDDNNNRIDMPMGTVRAFDARTGALRWSWEPIPRNPPYRRETHARTRRLDHRSCQRLVGDGGRCPTRSRLRANRKRKSRLLRRPQTRRRQVGELRSCSPRQNRPSSPGDSNSCITISGTTTPPRPRCSRPFPHDGKRVPVVIQGNKTGFLYVLNRDTGVPIFPVEERASPTQRRARREAASPTQPIPTSSAAGHSPEAHRSTMPGAPPLQTANSAAPNSPNSATQGSLLLQASRALWPTPGTWRYELERLLFRSTGTTCLRQHQQSHPQGYSAHPA